jgi:hypothetical protein
MTPFILVALQGVTRRKDGILLNLGKRLSGVLSERVDTLPVNHQQRHQHP